MRKIVEIGGKSIVLESNMKTLFIYKSEFKRDYFSDLLHMMTSLAAFEKMEKLSQLSGDTKKFKNYAKKLKQEDFDDLNITDLLKYLFAFAKTADPSLTTFYDFIGQFEDFDLEMIGKDVLEMLTHSMKTKKK